MTNAPEPSGIMVWVTPSEKEPGLTEIFAENQGNTE